MHAKLLFFRTLLFRLMFVSIHRGAALHMAGEVLLLSTLHCLVSAWLMRQGRNLDDTSSLSHLCSMVLNYVGNSISDVFSTFVGTVSAMLRGEKAAMTGDYVTESATTDVHSQHQ